MTDIQCCYVCGEKLPTDPKHVVLVTFPVLRAAHNKCTRVHAEWGEWCWCKSVHPTDRDLGVE